MFNSDHLPFQKVIYKKNAKHLCAAKYGKN